MYSLSLSLSTAPGTTRKLKLERSMSPLAPLIKQDEVFSEEEGDEDSSDEDNIIDVDKFTRTEYYTPGRRQIEKLFACKLHLHVHVLL